MADTSGSSPLWPADNAGVIAHLSQLQGIITRLANNSVSCKTWCLTVVSALVSLAGATHAPGILTYTLVPVTIFGFMDTMYLAQEKAYRDLFQATVTSIRNGKYVLSGAFESSASIKGGHVGWAFFSWAVLPVYAGLLAAYLIAWRAGWLTLLTAPAK